MGGLDIPPIPEFIEMISDSGAGLYACKASVDMFKLTRDDFIDQVDDIITVGEFYETAGGDRSSLRDLRKGRYRLVDYEKAFTPDARGGGDIFSAVMLLRLPNRPRQPSSICFRVGSRR